MTISIDWGTRIITIEKADMALIQMVPFEIRELSLNDFRMSLKALESSTEGIPHLDTHRHNTQVSLGGLTLARTIEIINGFTITFENGNYAVNAVGANSNLADVLNLNNVSLRSFNSAGLQTVVQGSGVTPQNVLDIATEVWSSSRMGKEILQILENQLVINQETSELWLYNDTGTMVLKKWPLRDINNDDIEVPAKGPSNRIKRNL